MRISFFSNAPWTHTGYANQTALFAPRLKALGHVMSIQASFGLERGALQWNGIPIYPRGFHAYGQDIMAANGDNFKADIVLSLLDAWVFEPSMHLHGMRWVPWFPIDMEPIPPLVLSKVAQSYQGIVYSRFAEREARRAGLDVRYVPHGVDTKVFAQMHTDKAREFCKLPADRWIVGMVATNTGTPSRKAFEPNLRGFRDFQRAHPEALLYLHTLAGQESQGVNLTELLGYLGLVVGRDVLISNQYDYLMGFPDGTMAALYNSFDVLLACSMGEGFGVPILEADPWWMPLASYQFMPRAGAITEALEQVYHKTWVRHVPDQVAGYDADVITQQYWQPVLAELDQRVLADRAVPALPVSEQVPA